MKLTSIFLLILQHQTAAFSLVGAKRKYTALLSDSYVYDSILEDIPKRSSCEENDCDPFQMQNVKRVNNHISSRDWLYNMKTISKSTVLKEICNPVLSLTSWASIFAIAHRFMATSSIPLLNSISTNMSIGLGVHSFLVSSLGLLLVFRTNSAYQRFVEGRKIWESILSTSRNLTRLLNCYEKEIGPERISTIKHLLAAFPYLLRHHIRPRCQIQENIPPEYSLTLHEQSVEVVDTRYEGDTNSGGLTSLSKLQVYPHYMHCTVDKRSPPWNLLAPEALEKCSKALNRPLWSCDRIAKEIVSVPYNGDAYTNRERLLLLSCVDKLSNAIGECERIHQTSIPLNYARHSLRGLTIWLFTLPFAVVGSLGLLTGPVCGITAWLLYGIYQIGHSIEDPFQKTLRLSMLCHAIKLDVLGDERRTSAFQLGDRFSNSNSSIDELNDIILKKIRGEESSTMLALQ
jgi:predicted membrane chloride channel (bestrophin family)